MLTTLIVLSALAAGLAGQDQPKDVPSAKTPARTDLNFLVDAGVLIHATSQYSALANERATPNVEKFAAQVAESHQQMQKRLAAAIKDQNVGVAAGTEKVTKEEVKRLRELEGKAFDRAYLARMVTDHRKLIELCENQVKNGKDAELSAFAESILPGLRKHLETAEGLSKDR
ncbi:MAG: DUF4142 domain-containing protein [Gemmataceae bacterium]